MKVAAVVYEPGEAKSLDDLLRAVAAEMMARGIRIAGTIQRNEAGPGNACAHMVLEDLVSSRAFDISVPAPTKTPACSLDPAALEDVAGHVTATLDATIEFVMVNRYGKQEVLACGLRSVIEQAVAEEIPVLTALCRTHLENWSAFVGDEWTQLPMDRLAILEWCSSVVSGSKIRAAMAHCP